MLFILNDETVIKTVENISGRAQTSPYPAFLPPLILKKKSSLTITISSIIEQNLEETIVSP